MNPKRATGAASMTCIVLIGIAGRDTSDRPGPVWAHQPDVPSARVVWPSPGTRMHVNGSNLAYVTASDNVFRTIRD